MKKRISLIIAAALMSAYLGSCAADTADGEPPSPSSEAESLPAAISFNEDNAQRIDLGSDEYKSDSGVKIKTSGTYIISGRLENGTLTVDTESGNETVLVLDGADISCENGAAIKIKKGTNAVIFLADGSENSVSGGGDSDDAAVISKSELDLNICGSGTLTVTGTQKHGIESAGNIHISDCKIKIDAKNVGINSKSSITLQKADITVNAGTDGVRAAEKFTMNGGNISLTSENDGIQAADAAVSDGFISVTSGGGSGSKPSKSSSSSKGIKASGSITVTGGTLKLDTSDDALHSNGSIAINGGSIEASTGDDGLHADKQLTITDGSINIGKCYEGLESAEILISGGDITINASDDGINAAGGKDSSGTNGAFGGRDNFSDRTGTIRISGGRVLINAVGDGIDSNDTVEISGGVTVINGPVSSFDSAFDFESTATVSGGVLAAFGSSGMAQAITEIKNQSFILYNTQQPTEAGVSFAVLDKDGKAVIFFTPAKEYSSALITSPDLADGEYTIVKGASANGTDELGLARNVSVTGGEKLETVTVENGSFSNGSFMGFGGFGGFGGRPDGNFDKNFDKNFGGRPDGNFDKNFDKNFGGRPDGSFDKNFDKNFGDTNENGEIPAPPNGEIPVPPDGVFPAPPNGQ